MPEIKSKNNRSRINTRILLRDNSGRNIPFFHFSEFPVSPAHRSCIGPLPFHQKHHPGHKIQDTPFPAFAFPLPRAQVFIEHQQIITVTQVMGCGIQKGTTKHSSKPRSFAQGSGALAFLDSAHPSCYLCGQDIKNTGVLS